MEPGVDGAKIALTREKPSNTSMNTPKTNFDLITVGDYGLALELEADDEPPHHPPPGLFAGALHPANETAIADKINPKTKFLATISNLNRMVGRLR